MAKLQSFSIAGVELWFWSHDHNPPHFHAKRRGEWEARVKFLENRSQMIEVIWLKSSKATIPKRDRNLLQKMVEEHRDELLKEWEEKVQPE